MVTAAERTKAGVVRLYEALEASCKVKYHCKKCNQLLGTSSNQAITESSNSVLDG